MNAYVYEGVVIVSSRRLKLNSVLSGLRGVDWESLGVEWAVLFGGTAKRGEGRDIDLLVMYGGEAGLDDVLRVADEVSRVLGVEPDQVDVVIAGRAPCAIVVDAWRYGITVYSKRPKAPREWLLTRIIICHDYEISRRKLEIIAAAIKGVERRWGRHRHPIKT